ncbi:component of the polarisome [Lobulomyces angularis]|nr:component of the polarisome [Lobulomyces angularis]
MVSFNEHSQVACQHYEAFRPYLASYLKSKKTDSIRKPKADIQRMRVQDILSLSLDIFDELNRRQIHAHSEPFLKILPKFDSRRNGARQKLATLATENFKALCADVYRELEKRFPEAVDLYESKYGENDYIEDEILDQDSYYKPPHNDTFIPVIPARSDSGRMDSSYQKSKAFQKTSNKPRAKSTRNPLDNLMADLSVMITDKQSADDVNAKRNYENKIHELQEKLSTLENLENEKIRQLEKNLESHIMEKNELSNLQKKLKIDLEQYRNDYKNLQQDYEEQQKVADKIRNEASNLLEEIKKLSELNETLLEENRRLAKLSSEPIFTPKKINLDNYNSGEIDGLIISDDMLQDFETAYQELINSARNENKTTILVSMKPVIVCCKNITVAVEDHFQNFEDHHINDLLDRVGDCLGNLMIAAKNHATSFGNSPSSLVLEPAEILANLIQELYSECNQNPKHITSNEQMKIIKLQNFLKDKTEIVVIAIQALLKSMLKTNTFEAGKILQEDMIEISQVVEDIRVETLESLEYVMDYNTAQQGQLILNDLEASKFELLQLGQLISNLLSNSSNEGNNNSIKRKKKEIAGCSYDIAKYIKELVNLIEKL